RLARRDPVLVAAVRQALGIGGADVRILVPDGVAHLDVLVLRREDRAPERQFAVKRQAHFPYRRQLEIGVDGVDGHALRGGGGGQVRVERVRAEGGRIGIVAVGL